MPELQPASETLPYPMPSETSRQLGVALQDTVRSSVKSMTELNERVNACVGFLKTSDVGPAQMIVTIKACAREGAVRNHALGEEFAVENADLLMEQIVKWAIVEYYRMA